MSDLMNRRDLLKLAGMGVAVFVSGTRVRASGSAQKKNESNDSFYFVQLSDTHWGFNGSNINPDSQGTLKHIHQEHHHMTEHIAHHAANSLMWALPEPGSVPKKAQIPWNAAEPYKGLGFRNVEAEVAQAQYEIEEFPISRGQ